ncbi:MAG: arabinan endo-1,5-alpha-L-arabinosidase [bacterium]|nr:arabinan endo-1,5-alpha-L-arabinosidase [bacterium]
MKFTYPPEPPRPAPKPKRPLPGRKPASMPAHSLWMIHDPAIYRDPVSGDYFLYCTNARILRSQDLITWESLGKAVEEPPAEAQKWTASKAIWAPDIVKTGGEYRLYCSNSSFGVRQSCIFLAVSDRATGPFLPRGIVLRTSERLNVNAIDANIAEDVRTGRQYMAYGSFWGGCHLIELDRETGLAKNGPDELGLCIARRPEWADTAIEGPYIIYHPDTDYYYLFVSYASLKSDYNIRVGRSRKITGPYLDHNGRDLRDLSDDDASLGYMIACGYKFDDDPVGYMGPGHNSVLRDADGEWYLVSHIRPHNFREAEPSALQIRKMLWSDDGWPLVSPEPYAGEKPQQVTWQLLVGSYERIKLTPTVPQGMLTSVKMTLNPNGTGLLADSVRIIWEMTDEYSLQIRYANTTEKFRILAAWDHEAWRPTLVLTGYDQKHICIWGKKF